MERFYGEPHTLWLPNEIIDKEDITFVLLAYSWVEKIEHTGEKIAEQLSNIGDRSPKPRGSYHRQYTSLMFTRAC